MSGVNESHLKNAETTALQMLHELNNDEKNLAIFGQLLHGIQNWLRLEKNKKYSTYYVDMYIGNNRLEFNGEHAEVEANIKKWFSSITF